jgi:hypothetical protein
VVEMIDRFESKAIAKEKKNFQFSTLLDLFSAALHFDSLHFEINKAIK